MRIEYPGPIPELLAYGLASLVSYSRIRGEQHFPADVFVGSIIGNLVAQQVYRRHHDPELGGDDWRYIGEIFAEGRTAPENKGSSMSRWIAGFIPRSIAWPPWAL